MVSVSPLTNVTLALPGSDEVREFFAGLYESEREIEVRTAPFKTIVVATDAKDGTPRITAQEPVIREIDPIRDTLVDTFWGCDILTVERDPTAGFKLYNPSEWTVAPPPGGAVFRMISFPAGCNVGIHRTPTIDVASIISGDIWLLLDGQELLLTPHDCVVLNGTSHGWENRDQQACMMAAVLLGTS